MVAPPGSTGRRRPADAIEATLARDDHPLGGVTQYRVGRRLVRPPCTRTAGPALLLPDDLAAQQQAEVVLEDRGDVGGQAPVRAAAEVRDVDGDAATRLQRADALGEHVAQHRQVVEVVAGDVTFAERRLVLLAGEVRRRGDHECHRGVGHGGHVAGITDVDDVEFAGLAERVVVADLGRRETRVEVGRVVRLALADAERRGGRAHPDSVQLSGSAADGSAAEVDGRVHAIGCALHPRHRRLAGGVVGEDPEPSCLDRRDDLGGHLARRDPAVDARGECLVDELGHRRIDGLGLFVLAHQVGLDELRAQDARADRRSDQFEFEEQALAQPDDRVLARHVRSDAGRAVEAGVRRGADDVADALLVHDRQRRPDAVDHAEHVDVEDALPQLDRVGPCVADPGDAGVVEHHVDAAELLDGVLDQHIDLGFSRRVAHHRRDARAVLAEPGLDVAQLRRVDVGEHDTHPLGDHRLGDGEADPARSTGDHGDIAGRNCRRARDSGLRVGHRPNLGRRTPPPPGWPRPTIHVCAQIRMGRVIRNATQTLQPPVSPRLRADSDGTGHP